MIMLSRLAKWLMSTLHVYVAPRDPSVLNHLEGENSVACGE